LKSLETTILVYMQHHVTIIFEKIRDVSLRWKELGRSLFASITNLH